MRSHQPKSHSRRSSGSVGHVVVGTVQYVSPDLTVHRQPVPQVPDARQLLQARVRDEQHVGLAGRRRSRRRSRRAAAGAGGPAPGRLGGVGQARLLEALDGAGATMLGEVAALGEQDQRTVGLQVGRERP